MPGIFGAQSKTPTNIGEQIYFALMALQHRGQESCGAVIWNNEECICITGFGYVRDVLCHLPNINGSHGIGFVGEHYTKPEAIPPFCRTSKFGHIAICIDGDIENKEALITRSTNMPGFLEHVGTTEEILVQLIASQKSDVLLTASLSGLNLLEGGHAIVMGENNGIYGYRDARGVRPLCIGHKNTGELYVSSETCVFGKLDARFLRHLSPGELINLANEESAFTNTAKPTSRCIYEPVYLSMPDSHPFSINVYNFRMALGGKLFQKWNQKANVVTGVPASGSLYALGYAEASGLNFDPLAITRNHYTPRYASLAPNDLNGIRTRIKLNVCKHSVEGQSIIVIDDTIVRGVTAQKLIKELFAAGAKEIHFGVPTPPLKSHCLYGVEIRGHESLLTEKGETKEAMRQFLGATTFEYLTSEEVLEVLKSLGHNNFCTGCLTGSFPF